MLKKYAKNRTKKNSSKVQTKKCEIDYCCIGAIGEKLCLTHNTDELLENREPTIDFLILFKIRYNIYLKHDCFVGNIEQKHCLTIQTQEHRATYSANICVIDLWYAKDEYAFVSI